MLIPGNSLKSVPCCQTRGCILSVVCIITLGLLASASHLYMCTGTVDAEANRPLVSQTSKTTLVFMGYNPKRADYWPALIRAYGVLDDMLDQIIILWCNPAVEAPWGKVADIQVPVKVTFAKAESSSLNELFNISHLVRTTSVLDVDDDLAVSPDLIRCMIALWNEDTRRLVGYGEDRRHITRRSEYRWQRPFLGLEWYSIVLDKTWLYHRDYLDYYMQNSGVIELVDATKNCEDIAMSSLTTIRSGLPPISIRRADRLRKHLGSNRQGISSNPRHLDIRSNCTKWFVDKYGAAAFVSTTEQRACLAGGRLQDARCERPGWLYERLLLALPFMLAFLLLIIILTRSSRITKCMSAFGGRARFTRGHAV
mmetsp:Transcript_97293/g.270681  ORF Transcript_97293/g.270681 Transcript_97293/m.270681 type:complete len:368 (-) Transcript_97293:20-1123(-)